jgi:hypothetical protein
MSLICPVPVTKEEDLCRILPQNGQKELMKMVNNDALNSAYRFIKSNCGDLHTSLFEYHFFKGSL